MRNCTADAGAPSGLIDTATGCATTASRGFDSRLSKRNWILARSRATSVQRWMSDELRPGSSIGWPSTVMRITFRSKGLCGAIVRVIRVMSTPS